MKIIIYRLLMATAYILVSGFFAECSFAQSAPSLGQAGSFAALGASTVTNTGPTNVVGDIGVSPGTAIVGFPPGLLTGGAIHANDALALSAHNDATIAYNQLAGQAPNAILTGTDLGGLTLPSGVYSFASSAQLTGTLTLDAQGNSDAVFVFQIGSALTTASNAKVVVINGGSGCNIFWQVGSSATIGTTTAFAGNIFALTSITLNTGASITGRMLALNGAITLDSNSAALCAICTHISLLPTVLPPAIVGVAYSQAITATGGSAPYTFAVASGILPAGMNLSSAGILSGTATDATTSTIVTIRATSADGCAAEVIFTLVVDPAACGSIFVSPTILPAPTRGLLYSQTFSASGGTAPYTFTVDSGSLPAGLQLSPQGVLSGIPTAAGNASFTIRASDAAGCSGKIEIDISINEGVCPTISLSPTTLPTLHAGVAYTAGMTAAGGLSPYAFSLASGALPNGLSIYVKNATSAVMSGLPSQPQNYAFTISVLDANGCAALASYEGAIAEPESAVPLPTLSASAIAMLASLMMLIAALSLGAHLHKKD